ncbi:MAG: tetratricopeptide repeat protein [Rhizobiales bacterium]|nr:tetratricopeptide repeat protein [Hyphomicrobiales bacterium]
MFQEVDEEVRREQLKKLWERHGHLAIAVAVLIVAGIGGWRGYDWWLSKKAAETGITFEAAAALSEEGKHAEAEAAFAKIAAEAPAGYRLLARFREAAELAGRDRKAAIEAYDTLAADSGLGRLFQDLAAVRAAYLLADTASYSEMLKRLEPLTAAGRPYRYAARELLAVSAWRTRDFDSVRRWSELILTDVQAPSSMRARVETLMALVPARGKG